MLDKLTVVVREIRTILKVALYKGSSQHGNALRAAVACWEEFSQRVYPEKGPRVMPRIVSRSSVSLDHPPRMRRHNNLEKILLKGSKL